MKEVRKVALWGLALYVLFLALIFFRLGPFAREKLSSLSFADATKLVFHLCLLAAGVLEIVNYAATSITGHGTHVAYSCHLLALWLQLLAFSAVLVLWSNTLRPPAKRGGGGGNGGGKVASFREKCRIHAAAIVVGVVDAAVFALTAVVIATPSADQASSYPYILLSMTYGVVLFALASWLVVYGLRLQRRVMDHPRWEPLDRGARLRILLRINGVLLVCAVCFLLRVAMLTSTLAMSSSKRMEELSGFAFEALARWLPTLLPAAALTHIMRKAEPGPGAAGSGSGGGGGCGWPRGGNGSGGSGGRGLLDPQVRVLDETGNLKEPLLGGGSRGGANNSSGINSSGPAGGETEFVYSSGTAV